MSGLQMGKALTSDSALSVVVELVLYESEDETGCTVKPATSACGVRRAWTFRLRIRLSWL